MTTASANTNDDNNGDVISSIWSALRDKPTAEDIEFAEKEKDLYKGQALTTRSEVLAWYLYDFANSPMFNVGIGLVFPLLLSSMATIYGCEHETLNGCDIDNVPIHEDKDLVVFMGSIPFKPAAFASAMLSISGAIQPITYILIGSLADYSSFQFYLFRICTFIASSLILIFVFLNDSSFYLFAGFLLAFQLCLFGLALIFYNASLPNLVENHWIIRRELRSKKIKNNERDKDIAHLKQQLSDDISQYGYGCGYFGSLLMTIIAALILAINETTEYEKLSIFGTKTPSDSVYNEYWLKRVNKIFLRFEDENLASIQLAYSDMTIYGNLYGSNDSNVTLQTYEIPKKNDFIKSIEFWLNANDSSINSLRFTSSKGEISSIYGPMNNKSESLPAADQIAIAEEDSFIFSGFSVYTLSNDKIMGIEPLFLNDETGQFQSTFGMRMVILSVSLWWNIWQFVTFKYLKRRDGPPLPSGSHWSTFSAKQFISALRSASAYPHMFRYLLSWFCFSDALNTVSVTAILFATTELNATTLEAAILVLEALFFGSWGGLCFLWIQRKLGFNAKSMLLLHIFIFILATGYAAIGLIPNMPFGLVNKWELFVFVFVYGTNWGSIQSYARSVFSYLVPIGKESQMFALYEITDKGSSWIGPLVVAIITNVSNIRWGMFYVSAFFVVSVPLLYFGVDLKIGMQQAGRWKESARSSLNNPNLAGVKNQIQMAEDKKGGNEKEAP